MLFYTHRYIAPYGPVAPAPHVFALREFIYTKVLDKSEMLPAMIEKDDIERNFEKFDEEMDSIDQTFEKIEGKSLKDLEEREKPGKLKTAVIVEVNWVAKKPNIV